jgi:hypothetical protein
MGGAHSQGKSKLALVFSCGIMRQEEREMIATVTHYADGYTVVQIPNGACEALGVFEEDQAFNKAKELAAAWGLPVHFRNASVGVTAEAFSERVLSEAEENTLSELFKSARRATWGR